MKKKNFLIQAGIISALGLTLLWVGVNTEVKAQSEAVTNAVSYLQNQSGSAGKVMALSAAGENPSANFLKSFSGSDAISYTKPILAITSIEEDPRTFPDEDFVEKLKSFEQDGQIGSPSAINDNAWGILALRSAGVPASDPLLQGAKNFILENQNSDGGWAWNVGGISTTDDTSAATMALLEMGVSKNHSAISEAIKFIKANQNEDGGFAATLSKEWGVQSNTSSTSWVTALINKLGENPESWTKEGNTPEDFMLSLQDEDGGFWWVEPGSSDWNNKAPTADVVIALTGNTFPIKSIEPTDENGDDEDENGNDEDENEDDNGDNGGDGDQNDNQGNGSLSTLRIEGSESQVCKTELESETALSIVEDAATICGYTYEIEESDFGPYLKSINGDTAQGMDGWLYFVNWQSPSVGAGSYELSPGDKVLWHFGEWWWKPLRITLTGDSSYSQGDTLSGIVEAVDEGVWSPVSEAEIKFDGENFYSEADGTFAIELPDNGVFELVAEKKEHVRSDITSISVGGVSNSVSLSVLITDEDPDDEEVEIGFKLSSGALSFGTLSPGGSVSRTLGVENIGQKDLSLEAEVSGDQVFNLLQIEGGLWSAFEDFLSAGSEKNLNLSLQIPSGFESLGEKSGELIIWGSATE